MSTLDELQKEVLEFRDERNWKQFHTLKNLVISLNLESAELLELTQWKADIELEESLQNPEIRLAIKDECSDVFMYLLLLAEHVGFDLVAAAQEKIKKNNLKYPVELSYNQPLLWLQC